MSLARCWSKCFKVVRGTRMAVLAITVTLAATLAAPGIIQASALEQQLNEQAKKAVAFLRQNDYKNVGVLKFRVKKGDEASSDNVGPLNMALARRLEIALVMADPKGELGHIRNASAVAARLPGANHLTKEGRAKLFEGSYPLVIGKDKVKPDALLGGFVYITPDLQQMAVDIRAFGHKDGGAGVYSVAKFCIPIDDPNILIETGESFRGAFGGRRTLESTETTKADPIKPVQDNVYGKEALVVKKQAEQYYPQLANYSLPVTLRINYGHNVIVPEIKDGKARILEPQTGERVSFYIKNNYPERVGVVLKVNGLNTLFKQKLRDLDCRKWILDPGESHTIAGFYYQDDRVVSFAVKSPQESADDEVNYGEDVGTISITVFRDGKDYVPPLPTPTTRTELAIAPGEFPPPPDGKPEDSFESIDQLRTMLRRGAEQTRGLIAEGREEYKANLQHVLFKPYPEPLMSATISYYTPQVPRLPRK